MCDHTWLSPPTSQLNEPASSASAASQPASELSELSELSSATFASQVQPQTWVASQPDSAMQSASQLGQPASQLGQPASPSRPERHLPQNNKALNAIAKSDHLWLRNKPSESFLGQGSYYIQSASQVSDLTSQSVSQRSHPASQPARLGHGASQPAQPASQPAFLKIIRLQTQ